jgi:DNA-binding beta-propeller fold protein YncE
MQRFIYNIILILGILPATVQAAEPVRIWELAGLSNPESVVYDPAGEALYVSNVNGAADAKDGNGFISRVSPTGEMLELNWVTGLDAPKGLALHNGRLYVADIDSLVEIDIAGAVISNTWTDSNAQFLNDVTAAADGRVFVSDMVTNRIHVLDNGSFSVWLEDAALENPNGLHAENGQLIVGAWGVMTDGFATEVPGHLKTVNLEDKSINSLGSGSPVGNLDGVEPVGGDFYVTDWMAGKLYRIDRAGNATLLLELEQGMADHEYMENDSVIVLPMMNNNTLLGYRVR